MPTVLLYIALVSFLYSFILSIPYSFRIIKRSDCQPVPHLSSMQLDFDDGTCRRCPIRQEGDEYLAEQQIKHFKKIKAIHLLPHKDHWSDPWVDSFKLEEGNKDSKLIRVEYFIIPSLAADTDKNLLPSMKVMAVCIVLVFVTLLLMLDETIGAAIGQRP